MPDYWLDQEGKNYLYKFWYGKDFLNNEFKPAVKGRTFDWDTKLWSAPVCARNDFVNSYLFDPDVDPYERYDIVTDTVNISELIPQGELNIMWPHQVHQLSLHFY